MNSSRKLLFFKYKNWDTSGLQGSKLRQNAQLSESSTKTHRKWMNSFTWKAVWAEQNRHQKPSSTSQKDFFQEQKFVTIKYYIRIRKSFHEVICLKFILYRCKTWTSLIDER